MLFGHHEYVSTWLSTFTRSRPAVLLRMVFLFFILSTYPVITQSWCWQRPDYGSCVTSTGWIRIPFPFNYAHTQHKAFSPFVIRLFWKRKEHFHKHHGCGYSISFALMNGFPPISRPLTSCSTHPGCCPATQSMTFPLNLFQNTQVRRIQSSSILHNNSLHRQTCRLYRINIPPFQSVRPCLHLPSRIPDLSKVRVSQRLVYTYPIGKIKFQHSG